MLENIFRHVEEGMKPMEAAIKGAGEIGFTIVSISFSLVAVFIPLLLMGGIVGRLFREFAVTVTAAVLVSAFVCLTLTPMMCSRFLRHDTRRHGLALPGHRGHVQRADRGSTGARWTSRCGIHFITLLVFLGTVSLSVYLYIIIPKGFFPPQDNGVVLGITEAAQDVSFKEMVNVQQRLADIVAQDPDTGGFVSSMGGGFGGQTEQHRAAVHLDETARTSASAARCRTISTGCGRRLPRCRAASCSCSRSRTCGSAARLAKTEYQYTLQDANLAELYRWAPKILGKLQSLPMLRDVTSDQQDGGTTATLVIDRDAAARFGIQPQVIDDTLYDAFGQRQITQYFSQVNSYHLILEVPPAMAGRSGDAGQAVCASRRPVRRCRSPPSCTGARCRCSHCRSAIRASSRR